MFWIKLVILNQNYGTINEVDNFCNFVGNVEDIK